MTIIFNGQANSYYNPPVTTKGIPKFGGGFRKKKLAFSSIYQGGAWRDFGNNVVIGSGDAIETKKQEFKAREKQQEAMDKIIKNTTRTKEDIIGGAFKIC